MCSLSVSVKVCSTSSCVDTTEYTAGEIWFWSVSGVEQHKVRKFRSVFIDCSCARMVLDTSNGGASVISITGASAVAGTSSTFVFSCLRLRLLLRLVFFSFFFSISFFLKCETNFIVRFSLSSHCVYG